MRSRPQRVIGHTATETRPRLLREAAVGRLLHGRKPDGERRVSEGGRRIVKLCCQGRTSIGVTSGTLTVPGQKATANYVPAAAVIRRWQALSGIIGRKARATVS